MRKSKKNCKEGSSCDGKRRNATDTRALRNSFDEDETATNNTSPRHDRTTTSQTNTNPFRRLVKI